MRRLLDRRRQLPVLFDHAVENAALAYAIGLYFLFAPKAIFTSVVYVSAAEVLPIWVWGVLFVTKGVAATVSLWSGWSATATTSLWGGVLYTFWAAISAYTSLYNRWMGGLGAILWSALAIAHVLLARACYRAAAL